MFLSQYLVFELALLNLIKVTFEYHVIAYFTFMYSNLILTDNSL